MQSFVFNNADNTCITGISSNPLLNELKVLNRCDKKKIKMVTQAIDYFEEDGSVYLVTKYVGVSLKTYLEERKEL